MMTIPQAVVDNNFCRLKPGSTVPEMTIVELQGDLETKSESGVLNGKFIGDLHFTKTVSFSASSLELQSLGR